MLSNIIFQERRAINVNRGSAKKQSLGLKNQSSNFKLNFTRMPDPWQEAEMRTKLHEAYDKLQKRSFLIIHASSIPSAKGENTGIGSLFSNGAKEFNTFLTTLGFDGLQLGPEGKTKDYDPSPYESGINSTSELYIDLKQLTTERWGGILSEGKFKQIVENMPKDKLDKKAFIDQYNFRKDSLINDYAKSRQTQSDQEAFFKQQREIDLSRLKFSKLPPNSTKYMFAQKVYTGKNGALREAYTNFKSLIGKSNTIDKLNEKFQQFKADNLDWLERDAVYEVISKRNGNDYYLNWEDDIDKHLYKYFDDLNSPQHKEAVRRRNQYLTENADEIEFYAFNQFVIDEQKKDMKEFNKQLGKEIGNEAFINIGDALVGYSPRDVWGHEEAFLPIDRITGGWKLPVIDPAKLFEDEEGHKLGASGKIIFQKFNKILNYYDGVRIDAGTRLYDVLLEVAGINGEPDSKEFLSNIFSDEVVDNFHKIYDKIVRRAVKDNNINMKNVLSEAIEDFPPLRKGDVTSNQQEREKFFIKHVLKDIAQVAEGLRKYKLKDAPKNSAGLITSHDQPSMTYLLSEPRKDEFDQINEMLDINRHDYLKSQVLNPEYLNYIAEYTCPPDHPGGLDAYKRAIRSDKKEFIKAKLVELMLSPSKDVHVSFTDLIQSLDIYNNRQPGLINWRLRMPDNYKKVYYAKLEKEEGINFPEILKRALQIKQARSEDKKQYQSLIEDLAKFEAVLKEKTPENKLEPDLKAFLEREEKIKKQFKFTIFDDKKKPGQIASTPNQSGYDINLPGFTFHASKEFVNP